MGEGVVKLCTLRLEKIKEACGAWNSTSAVGMDYFSYSDVERVLREIAGIESAWPLRVMGVFAEDVI